MRKIISLFLISFAVNVAAQNLYDVSRFVDSDLVGTARFVGMGGAMSALGSDISVISTNPAGIALYRSNDVVASMGFNTFENEADFLGTNSKSDKTSLSIDNVGMVIAANIDCGSIKYLNFAFNYRHRNNFKNKFNAAGSLIDADNKYFSQQYQLQKLFGITEFAVGETYYDDYTSLQYPWLGLLTSTSGLLDSGGELIYVPDGPAGLYPDRMSYYSKEKGGVDEVETNISCNINDRIYLGLTIGATNVDYTKYSEYTEHCANYDYYTLQNRYNISGHGFNIKLGAIFRPFEYSPFKVGVAIHTPTWYQLTNCSSATMIGADGYALDTRDYDYSYGEDLLVDYDVTTPWKFNISASYTFDNFVAVDAEYEMVDYSSLSMEFADGWDVFSDDYIEDNLRVQHIFRVGALFNISKEFSLRCGYNYISSPYSSKATKSTLVMSDTSTDFSNVRETNIVTLGAGFTSNRVYFDMAYKLAMQNSDFYNYYDSEFYNPSASVTTNKHSLVMSLGYRF